MDKIEEQEDRLYVAPSRILQRLHYLYNLEQDAYSQENALFWQTVYNEYTSPSCCSSSKASVMARFLHSAEKLANFYNRKVGDKADQSVYAYTPARQKQIKEWYKHVQEEGSIPCDMSFDLCVDDSCIAPCLGGPVGENNYSCCEPPYATHPQTDWCCVTHILGALWCSDHPNAGFCFFQC